LQDKKRNTLTECWIVKY